MGKICIIDARQHIFRAWINNALKGCAMEFAKITANGQITLPVQVRKILNLKDGDKVMFTEKEGRVFVENPTKSAIAEAQKAFAGLADELGLKTDEDVVTLCKEVRQEMWETRHANHA
jgi:AbrB family looped-hinge helix DNA binding protein